MAKRKRKTSGRSTASRRKNRTQDRMPAGLITLFAGLVLMALAFVPGSSAWRAMHDVLFGAFGCGSFVLGAALCYLAILYTRGEDLLPHIAKLALGLIFASGTVIVFSDIPTDQTAAQMTAACYQNGMSAWLSGGALGAVLGGTLLLLCGRPAANLVMAALAACASLYIFDVTPAECWQWLCNVGGSVHEKGLAVHEQNAARRAERLAERAAEEAAAEEYEAYDDDLPEDEVGGRGLLRRRRACRARLPYPASRLAGWRLPLGPSGDAGRRTGGACPCACTGSADPASARACPRTGGKVPAPCAL